MLVLVRKLHLHVHRGSIFSNLKYDGWVRVDVVWSPEKKEKRKIHATKIVKLSIF